MNLEEKKEFAYEDVRLLTTYVRFNDYEFPAGKAIFHPQSGKVLQTVSNGYTFIHNKEFVQFLNSFYSLKIYDIYINHSYDTFAFSGYFLNEDDFVWMDEAGRKIRVGFELYNAYNNKYQPQVTYSYFIDDPQQIKPYFIRTSIPIFEFTRKEWAEDRDSILLSNRPPIKAMLLGRDSRIPDDQYDKLVKHYKGKIPSLMHVTFNKILKENPERDFYTFLRVIGLTTQIWERTSYEVATREQKGIYNLTQLTTI